MQVLLGVQQNIALHIPQFSIHYFVIVCTYYYGTARYILLIYSYTRLENKSGKQKKHDLLNKSNLANE